MVDSPLATVAQLRVKPGITADITDATLADALETVSAVARGEAPPAGDLWDIEAAPNTTGHIPARVRVVVLEAAKRRVLNPDAYVQENSGDYGYRRAEGTEGADYFTAAELRILRDYQGSATGGLSTIRMTRSDLIPQDSSYYVDTNDGGRALPWSYS